MTPFTVELGQNSLLLLFKNMVERNVKLNFILAIQLQKPRHTVSAKGDTGLMEQRDGVRTEKLFCLKMSDF